MFLNIEQGLLGGNDLLSPEGLKKRRLMTIYIEYYRRKWEVMPDECQVPS